MSDISVAAIGTIVNEGDDVRLVLNPNLFPGIQGLTGFSHLQVVWWADGCDNPTERASLTEQKPYKNGPDTIGVFATRSPARPNPIAISTATIAYVDEAQGIVGLYYIDANHGTPILDIKPYTPSLDRVEQPRTPEWCAHWPQSLEASSEFAWDEEFNF